jgi:accessory gene regulator B
VRFIQRWSFVLARSHAAGLEANHNKRHQLYFEYQVLLGSLFKGLILGVVAFILGILYQIILILVLFALIRVFAGGHHMQDYTKCLITSSILFLGLGGILKYLYPGIVELILLSILVFAALLYNVFKHAPRDTPYKPITKPEQIRVLRNISFAMTAILCATQVIFINLGLTYMAFALCLGMFASSFFLSNTGYKFFDYFQKINL